MAHSEPVTQLAELDARAILYKTTTVGPGAMTAEVKYTYEDLRNIGQIEEDRDDGGWHGN